MTPRLPRSSRTRGPLDPLPEPTGHRFTTVARCGLAGVALMLFGLVMMITTPSGPDADALAQSAWPAGLHAVGALIGVVGGAILLGMANEAHADSRR